MMEHSSMNIFEIHALPDGSEKEEALAEAQRADDARRNSQEQVAKRRKVAFKSWGVPPAFFKWMDQDIQQPPEVIEKIQSWSNSDTPCLVLSGDNGTGKTTLACQLISKWYFETVNREWEEHKRESRNRSFEPSAPMFTKQSILYHEWLDEVRGGTGRRGGSVNEMHEKYAEPHLLVLDDFGVKAPTEGFREWVISLIDHRMDHCKKTIVTTNLNVEAVREYYGETMVSRLLNGAQIKMTGKDMRQRL